MVDTLLHPDLALLGLLASAVSWITAALFLIALFLHLHHRTRTRRRRALDARWEPVLHGLMAGDLDAATFWRQVGPRETAFLLDFLLRYAFAVQGEARSRLNDLARPFLKDAVRELRRRTPERRAHAVHTLGTFGMPRHAAHLIAALSDPSDFVALTAARALATSPNPEHAEVVLDALDRFRVFGPHLIASLLADVGTALVPMLVALFADATRPLHTRLAAADALRWIGSPDAADPARALLLVEHDREVRAACLRLLRAVGTDEHAAAARAFATDADPVVRMHAVTALARLGTRADAGYLEHALADTSGWVALRAARGLRELRARDVLERVAADGTHAGSAIARQTLAE